MNTFSLSFTLLAFCSFAAADPQAPSPTIPSNGWITSLDVEPSGWIDGVNVITGEYVDHEVDLTIAGPKPLRVERTLIGNNPGPANVDKNPSWHFAEGGTLLVEGVTATSRNCTVSFLGPHGEFTAFKTKEPKEKSELQATLTHPDFFKKSVTNTSSGVVGASTNIRHHHILWQNKKMELLAPNGVKRFAEKFDINSDYRVTEEIHPDRLSHHFTHATRKAQVVKHELRNASKTLSSYTWEKTEKYYDHCKSSDRRQVKYFYNWRGWEGTFSKLDPYFHDLTFWKKNYLTRVIRSEAPEVRYEYYPGKIHKSKSSPYITGFSNEIWEHPKLKRKIYPYGRILELHYYWLGVNEINGQLFNVTLKNPLLSRISYLRAPLGLDSELHVKQQFLYNFPNGKNGPGTTTVYDALHHRTDYHFGSRKRLKKIQKFDDSGALYSEEQLFWGPKDTPQEIELKSRAFSAAGTSGFLFDKEFVYDGAGNILKETLYGNLTGRNPSPFHLDPERHPIEKTDTFIRHYNYSGGPLYLLLEAQEGEITRYFSYIPDTNLLASELHANNERIYLRHFYTYDENGLVVESIIDDGVSKDKNDLNQVTERHIRRTERSIIMPHGMPLIVSDYCYDLQTGTEIKLTEERNLFDLLGRLIQKSCYDAESNLLTEEKWSYDSHGNCLLYTDPLGLSSIYTYDENDNKVSEHTPGEAPKRFVYDFMNRLIASFEDHPDGTLATYTRYDLVSNPIATIDALGHETSIEYDAFNRPCKVTAPALPGPDGTLVRPETHYTFDPLSRPIEVTDPLGRTTKFSYSILGKPTTILHPDGSEEKYFYDLQGRLVEEIDKAGTQTLYQRDYLGRITCKQVFDPNGNLLVQTQAGYNTFRLLWETDPSGVMTTYTYDESGRKLTETKGEITTSFTYDSAGRLASRTTGEAVLKFKYNPLGQLIEETSHTLSGLLLTQKNMTYDMKGRVILTTYPTEKGVAILRTAYDTHDIPIELEKPDGGITRQKMVFSTFNEWGQHVIALETIDPLGNKTLSIKNTHGKEALEEKYTPFGEKAQRTSHFYSLSGQKIATCRTVLQGGQASNEQKTEWNYDLLDRPLTYTQAAGTTLERRTSYAYDRAGRLVQETSPAGTSICFEYDALGRKTRSYASDASLDYRTDYDAAGRPLQTLDVLHSTSNRRSYNDNGLLVQESLGNGLALNYRYRQGQLEEITLPDSSTIHYTYEGPSLRRIGRKHSTGILAYEHVYTAFDLAGRLLKEELPFNLGETKRSYTLGGHLTSLTAPHFEQTLKLDLLSHPIERTTRDPQGERTENFAYDTLHQLTQTGQESYSYNSLYQRTSKNGTPASSNVLNQLLHDGASTYTYGLAGELLKIEGEEEVYFTYDPLLRLTSIQRNGHTIKYIYDELGRALKAQVYTQGTLTHEENRLYWGFIEIGSFTPEGKPLTLRVLGERKTAEIGAAISIEIEGTPYIPLHDSQGNTALLLSSQGEVIESYRYTPFGEETLLHGFQDNPWRFSSKRVQLGLLQFGHRFYDPAQARWITPDPLKEEAGPNPYAFLFNNPLIAFDPYGLAGEENRGFFERARDFISRCGEAIRGFFSRSYEKSRDSLHRFGERVETLCRHVIPLPVVKDIPCAFAHLLTHRSLSNYIPSWRGTKSHYCGENAANPRAPAHGNVALYVNGMNNSHTEAIQGRDLMAGLHFAERVDGIHLQEHGTMESILRVCVSKLGILTESVRATLQGIRSAIDAIGGVDSRHYVVIAAFSQGGQEVHHAIQYLSKEEKARLIIGTFGTAKIINDNDLAYCQNYVDSRDPITLVSDLPTYGSACLGLVSNVTFLKAQDSDFWKAHQFASKTYQKGLSDFHVELVDRGFIK